VRDGAIELSEFVPTSELRLDSPGTTLDPDVAARWGSLAPDREWRNLNLTPRFDESARMAADLWAASGRGEVDGVLSMDVAALVDLLALTGPVDVDGRRLDADSARDLLLVGQYREVPDTDERRELLGRVVAAAFTAFDQRPVPVSGLVRLFRDAGAGRHLLAWSSDPVQQAAWVELGVSGTVPADAVVLSVLNRGGTKLDPYLRVDATMTVRERGDHRRMEVRVQIDNTAPPGLPRYVAGPVTVTGATDPGDYVGIVALTVPGSATAPSISTEGFAVVGDDGDTRVVGGNVLVPAGTSTVVEIGVDLPLELDTLWILPGARLPATTWNVDGETWTERRPRPIDLEAVGSDRG
jgi:hypothetical protein